MCQPTNDARTLNMIISDMTGCNIKGRIEYSLRLLDGGDISEAKSELNDLLDFIGED